MSYEIYTKPGKRIIPLIGEQTEVFPSGLIRFSQTFAAIGKRGLDEALARFNVGNKIASNEILASLYVYPSPVFVLDSPGIYKLNVTAYGARSFEFLRSVVNKRIVNISKSYQETEILNDQDDTRAYNWTISEKWLVDAITTSGVVGEGQEPKASERNISQTFLTRRISGRIGPTGARQINPSWVREPVALTERNFGRVTEYDLTETLIPIY
jgi:hypothetical protein